MRYYLITKIYVKNINNYKASEKNTMQVKDNREFEMIKRRRDWIGDFVFDWDWNKTIMVENGIELNIIVIAINSQEN